mgnify:CR=1 FL=1|jgi:Glycosyltransferase involved in LPS biosynthesis
MSTLNHKRAAYFINLDSRTDRLLNVQEQIRSSRVLTDWNPQRWSAFSPANTAKPSWYHQSHGYWASKASHLAILEKGIIDEVDYLMVIEDDIDLASTSEDPIIPSFDDTFEYLWERLPQGWMGVQFGGYHISPPSQIMPGIVRLWRFFECPLALYSKAGIRRVWDAVTAEPNTVFDWGLMTLYHAEPHFFAPEMLPVRQISSYSDNEGYINH